MNGQLIGIMVLLILFSINTTEAKTITVGDIKGADYSRLQDAVYNAQVGDTILVQPGTYFENVSINKSLIIKGLSVREEKPLIHEKKSDTTIVILADNVTIDGFRITNSVENTGTGILVLGNNTVIQNNTIWNSVRGIHLRSSGNNSVIANTIFSNILQDIFLEYSENNLISGNIFSKNDNICLLLTGSSNNSIKSNSFLDINYGVIIEENSENNLIYDNLFIGVFPITFYSENVDNNFSIAITPGINIAKGEYLGGNVWAKSDGSGYSQNCDDQDSNGICDSPYIIQKPFINEPAGIDRFPLVYKPLTMTLSKIILMVSAFLSVLAAVHFKRKEIRNPIPGTLREIARGIIGMILGVVIGYIILFALSEVLPPTLSGTFGEGRFVIIFLIAGGFAGIIGGLSRDPQIAAIVSVCVLFINSYSISYPYETDVAGIISGIILGYAIFGAKNDSRQGAIYGGLLGSFAAAIHGLLDLSVSITGSILGGFFLGGIFNKIQANRIVIYHMIAASIAGLIGGIAAGLYIGPASEIEVSIISGGHDLILLIPIAGAICSTIAGIFMGKREYLILYTVIAGGIIGIVFSSAGFAIHDSIDLSLSDRIGNSLGLFPLIFSSMYWGLVTWASASILKGKMEGEKK